jgi:hypothetical protein
VRREPARIGVQPVQPGAGPDPDGAAGVLVQGGDVVVAQAVGVVRVVAVMGDRAGGVYAVQPPGVQADPEDAVPVLQHRAHARRAQTVGVLRVVAVEGEAVLLRDVAADAAVGGDPEDAGAVLVEGIDAVVAQTVGVQRVVAVGAKHRFARTPVQDGQPLLRADPQVGAKHRFARTGAVLQDGRDVAMGQALSVEGEPTGGRVQRGQSAHVRFVVGTGAHPDVGAKRRFARTAVPKDGRHPVVGQAVGVCRVMPVVAPVTAVPQAAVFGPHPEGAVLVLVEGQDVESGKRSAAKGSKRSFWRS